MNLDKASQWIIVACLVGLGIMVAHIQTKEDWMIPLLLVPVAMMLYAKGVNKKELEDDKRREARED